MPCSRSLGSSITTVALASLVCVSPAAAQTPAQPQPPPFREGTVDLALLSTTGNSSTLTFGLGAEVIVRPESWVVRQRATFLRSEAEDVLTAESFTYLVRVEKVLKPRLSVYGDYDYLRDEFAGVEHKHTISGGLTYRLVEPEPHALTLLAGLGYTNERRVVRPGASGEDGDLSSAVFTAGWDYRLRFSETAELTDELIYEQPFAVAEEWRLDHLLAVTARLTSVLSLKASYGIRYANEPVEGFARTDTRTALALVAKF